MQNVATSVLVVCLTVLASLGSFGLSRFAHSRQQTALGWAALAIGTVFLLTGVAIVVVTSSRLALVPWLAQVDEGAVVGPLSADVAAPRASPFQPQTRATSTPFRQATGKPVSSDLDLEASDRRQAEPAQRGPPSRADSARLTSFLATRRSGGLAFNAADPWAATRCVIPIQRDPAEPTRWTVENDCPAAVGIVIAVCSDSAGCGDNSMRRWTYEAQGAVLPEKRQRSVTEQEQTFYGDRVEHLACALSSERAFELIGASSEVRATQEWQGEFAEARALDDCLAWVVRLSEHGRRTGIRIDAMSGGSRLSHVPN